MPLIKTTTAALMAALLPALTRASTLSLSDTGLPTSCGAITNTICCIPSCRVNVGDWYGCSSYTDFSGTCQWNFDNPGGTLDVCSDSQLTFLRDPDGNPVVDLYHKPSKTYDRYQFYDCQAPSGGGNGQCVPSGGGCSTRQTLTGAQG